MRALLLLLGFAGLTALGLSAAAGPAAAQADTLRSSVESVEAMARADAAGVGLSDAATASVLTMLPGREVYSLFGHTAIRIHDPAAGLDRTYNYGTFDFEQPGFVVRFAGGRLDYILATAPYADEIAKYQWLGRTVIEQTLALDPPTVRALYDALEVNALPENRAYRYDFLFDNCSTRPLDILDASLRRAGRPPIALAPVPEATFRERLAPYLVGTPLVELGIGLALGAPVDRVATPREATFLPVDLAAALDAATVGGRPLVARRDTVYRTDGPTMPARAPRWPVGVAALVLAAAVALMRWRERAPAFDAALFAVVGVAGVVLLLLGTVTEHHVTAPNLNLAWAWPTHLAAAVALARRPGAFATLYLKGAALAAGGVGLISLVGLAPQPLPAEAILLALAVAVRAGARAWRP